MGSQSLAWDVWRAMVLMGEETTRGRMLETQNSDGNGRTQVLGAVDEFDRQREAHREAFVRAWPRVRPAVSAFGRAGFVLVAQRWRSGTGLLETARCLELPLDDGQSAHRIVGRHTRADLVLRGDHTVSLRHLLVTAWSEDGQPAIRVLDTGTEGRFLTELGVDVAAMKADGTCFWSVGTWNLMAIYTEPDQDWPEDPAEAWAQLPPRDAPWIPSTLGRPELRARAYPFLRGAANGAPGTSTTQILHLEQPEELGLLPPDSPLAVGALFLPDRRSVRLSVNALTRGVLIGRYGRCGVDQDLLAADESISRIHLCLVQDPTGLWAVDMASTNGTRVDGDKVRAMRLGRQADLTLARSTRLRWEMA